MADDIEDHEKRLKGISRFLEQDRTELAKLRRQKADLADGFRDVIDDLLDAVRCADSSDKSRTVKDLLKKKKDYPDVAAMHKLALARIEEAEKFYKTVEKLAKTAKQNAADFHKAMDDMASDWKKLKNPPPDVPGRFEALWKKYREAEKEYDEHFKTLAKWKPEKFDKSAWEKYVEEEVVKKPFVEWGDDFL